MTGKLEGPAFDKWRYDEVIKPLSTLGTGANGTGAFFRGAVADLLAQQEHTQNPDAVITALETIFARRASEHPEDAKSPMEAAEFVGRARASIAQAIAKRQETV